MGRGGYGTVDFWEEWYAEENHENFDWLVDFEDIGAAVEACARWDHEARILVTGCGNSPFSSEMFSRGYRNLVNVDNCEVIVAQQRSRYPMLRWVACDVRATPFEDQSFDLVLDKGLLDNLYCYIDPDANVARYLAEMRRVLKPGGRCFIVSCHDAAATAKSLAALPDPDWTYAHVDLPNPRWPRIPIQTYQLALCERGRSAHPDHPGLADVLADALARLKDSSCAPITPLPARVHHLEQRASGLRHSTLIDDEKNNGGGVVVEAAPS